MLAFLQAYLPALAVTLALEGLVVLAFVRGDGRRRALWTCLSLNLLTHPLATLVLLVANAPFVLLEVTILGVEFLGYRALLEMGPGRALAVALVANVASAAAGLLWS